MAEHNTMNVSTRGGILSRNTSIQTINPRCPLVELPDVLNPFRDDGVRIYAKMMTA